MPPQESGVVVAVQKCVPLRMRAHAGTCQRVHRHESRLDSGQLDWAVLAQIETLSTSCLSGLRLRRRPSQHCLQASLLWMSCDDAIPHSESAEALSVQLKTQVRWSQTDFKACPELPW